MWINYLRHKGKNVQRYGKFHLIAEPLKQPIVNWMKLAYILGETSELVHKFIEIRLFMINQNPSIDFLILSQSSKL